MIKRLLSTAAAVIFTSGVALAQTTSGGTGAGGTAGAGTMGAGGMSGFSSWDQTTRDAFFSGGSLRSETELQAGWDALDTAQQDQIRADCQAMSANAGGSGTTQTQAGASTTTGTGAGATSGSGAGSTSSDTTASTTTGTGTGATAGSGSATGATGTEDMPDMAAMQQFCTHVQSF
jgi:hypothetical protein